MRILVHEFATGGGLAGRPIPASLAREGAAMRAGLLADLAALGRHEIMATADPRFPLRPRAGVEVVRAASGRPALSGRLIASVDAVWLIAPEIDRCLERLAARVERRRTRLLGPGAAAIARASDKASLSRRLSRCGVPHPVTRLLRPDADATRIARSIGYPVVVKPARGAGCIGVALARNAHELRDAVEMARDACGRGPLLLQQYILGVAASVSLLCDGRRAVALSVNAQVVRPARRFGYRGGRTPLAHPLASRAIDRALRTCGALPGLRGYVGVDLVLTDSEAIVIEVNPRLTTSYLGVRAALRGPNGAGANIAGLVIDACDGELPAATPLLSTVRFTADGRILAARPEPFDSPLIMSLSKDERLAQDVLVDQPPRVALRRSAVALAKAEGRARGSTGSPRTRLEMAGVTT